MDYFNDYFGKISYKDDFGHDSTWNNEMNEWLKYAFELDKDFYERNKNRVVSEKQRDEFLGELKSLYFIGKKLGFDIAEIEPAEEGLHLLDFSFWDSGKNLWKVEVKSPSWRARVFKSSATKPDKLRRLALPQLIDEKPEFIDPENETKIAIEDAIKNALPKFRKGDNNMLIITPNMNQQILVMMAIQSMTGTNNLIQDEIRRQDKNRLISAVLVLEPTYYLSEGKVNYYRKFIPII